jgi:glyoxylase-like metal-dependent hydrolase (beta-lactamase superfamily II)
MTTESLTLIDLDIEELGYYHFISSWLYQGSDGTFLVDPGPACTIPKLLRALDDRNVTELSWVLLTHIHQDHAGGLGDLIEKYPSAKVVTHKKGAQHLVNPEKLWDGSKDILGEVAQIYGKIRAIPEENITILDTVPFGAGIRIIPTPGHASHHQCYIFKEWFFAGELFGAHIPMDIDLYLRPATPHRFILKDYLNSMELVEPELQNTICFAHYGSTGNPKKVLMTARDQLKLWVKIIEENLETQNMVKIFNQLLENDEVFGLYNKLDEKMKIREKTFSINSVDGIMKYLKSKGNKKLI